MIKTSTIQLQLVCPGCKGYHAVSGIKDMEICQKCGKNIDVSAVLNDRIFAAADRVKYMNAFLSGSVEQMGGEGAYKLVYSSTQPYCEECVTVINTEQLMESLEADKPYICSNCSHAMPVRKADSEVKQFHPMAIGVINDSDGTDLFEKNTDKDSMLVFKCMTCGAGLELSQETKRTIQCKYCDNENYLPDSIWTKLHPDKEVQPLFLLLDLEEADITGSLDYFLRVTALRAYQKHFENFIREYFERPFVNDSVILWFKTLVSAGNNKEVSFNLDVEKIKKYFYDNLKLGLSSHSIKLKAAVAESGTNIPVDLQLGLALDSSEEVRIALAKNPNLSGDVIKKLQKDSSSAVSELAKKQKKGFLKSIFG